MIDNLRTQESEKSKKVTKENKQINFKRVKSRDFSDKGKDREAKGITEVKKKIKEEKEVSSNRKDKMQKKYDQEISAFENKMTQIIIEILDAREEKNNTGKKNDHSNNVYHMKILISFLFLFISL